MSLSPAKKKRLLFLSIMLLGLAGSLTLFLLAFQENIIFFYAPSEVKISEQDNRFIRIGGMVSKDSLKADEQSTSWEFDLTDYKSSIHVTYQGLLPVLFKEGQGAVVLGKFDQDQIFRATEILAKHDENYMPKNIADKLNDQGEPMKYSPTLQQNEPQNDH